jgi:hypothetical protein
MEESLKPELGNYSFSRYSGPDSYDVDREQVLAHELQNDGQDLWLECRERDGRKHGK